MSVRFSSGLGQLPPPRVPAHRTLSKPSSPPLHPLSWQLLRAFQACPVHTNPALRGSSSSLSHTEIEGSMDFDSRGDSAFMLHLLIYCDTATQARKKLRFREKIQLQPLFPFHLQPQVSCPPAGGTLGFSSSRQPHPAGRGQLGMGCLWGRMALHPPVGLHRDTHWWPGPGCIWHVAPSHLPCGISPAPELRADTRTHPGLIKGLLLIYSKSLQENRARNSTTAISC